METASPLSLSLPTVSFHFLHRRRLLPVYSPPSSVRFTVILEITPPPPGSFTSQFSILCWELILWVNEKGRALARVWWTGLYILLLYSYEQNYCEKKQNLEVQRRPWCFSFFFLPSSRIRTGCWSKAYIDSFTHQLSGLVQSRCSPLWYYTCTDTDTWGYFTKQPKNAQVTHRRWSTDPIPRRLPKYQTPHRGPRGCGWVDVGAHMCVWSKSTISKIFTLNCPI